MGSNGCIINENGEVFGPQNNLLDDESIVNIVRSAFSYKEREMDSESHQSSQNMERERWLRHRDSNGNPIYHNVSDLPDI